MRTSRIDIFLLALIPLGFQAQLVVDNTVTATVAVQDFLLGFSQPNFYFHATTAYDIMRMKGIAIGKIDYLGAMPVKR